MEALRGAFGGETIDSLLAFSGGTIPDVKSADAAQAVRLGASLGRR